MFEIAVIVVFTLVSVAIILVDAYCGKQSKEPPRYYTSSADHREAIRAHIAKRG